MIHVEVTRKHGEYGFEAADMNGHKVRLDTSPDTGGENYGVRPMQMLLMGLGGCSGIDVISILKKQRQTVRDFKILIDGEREKGKEATLWVNIHMKFELKGKIDLQKAQRACELSVDKYCSVAATLMKAGCKLTWDVNVIHEE
jgi:putative redox protein